MEGSSLAKAHAYIRQTQVDCLQDAGLPVKAATAWTKFAPVRFSGNFKRDAALGGKVWRGGSDLLTKLPKKPLRSPPQQAAADFILSACRQMRESFLKHHAEAVYRKLTKNLANLVRVDDLVYDVAKVVPGLTPTRKQVDAQSGLMQSEKDGLEVDQGIFLAQVLAVPDTGMHLCEAMLAPKQEALERTAEFIRNGVVDFGPARVERRGK